MDYLSLKVEKHIGIVTVNKPPVNSYNYQCYQEYVDMFRSIDRTDDVWVVVLRAEGKHFSTGNDVREFARITDIPGGLEYARMVSDGIGSVYECRVPVIGAVQGMVLGGGLAFASCCDIIVASENASFGIPEIKIGFVGAACFISRMLPQQLHRYMAYSGDMMTARQLEHYGAVLKVVPHDQLLSSAMVVAERLLDNPPQALRGFKAAMNENENARLKEKYALEIGHTKRLMFGTEDFNEAVNAFLEKRKPVYKAR